MANRVKYFGLAMAALLTIVMSISVEFFNLILGLGLGAQEKKDLVEFMRSL